MDKLKKIDKKFLITDNSLNVYKYRLLTSGYLMDEFKRNPIGYRMHNRDGGVVVRWEDFQVDGDKVYASPVVNLSHPDGQRTVDEIENGFLNAASVGKIVALEISTNLDDYLEGQEGPTISKWFNRELSLVDIPGNYNALTDLVDANDTPLNLDAFQKPNTSKMKQLFLSAAQIGKLDLKADSDEAALDLVLNDLVAKAKEVAPLKQENATLKTEISNLKAASVTKEVKDLIDKGLGEKRFTQATADKLKGEFSTNPAGLKDLIDTMKPYASITGALADAEQTGELKDLMDKSYEQLDRSNKLERLKELSLDGFKAKYKTRFGKDYAK